MRQAIAFSVSPRTERRPAAPRAEKRRPWPIEQGDRIHWAAGRLPEIAMAGADGIPGGLPECEAALWVSRRQRSGLREIVVPRKRPRYAVAVSVLHCQPQGSTSSAEGLFDMKSRCRPMTALINKRLAAVARILVRPISCLLNETSTISR